MDEMLILVDEMDRQTGSAGKSEVHEHGLLHRAFSVFVFNSKGELLLQRRALTKYHSGGLWTNTCCGHPVLGEKIKDAAQRRLKEEMNMSVPVEEICVFKYKANFSNGLIENEVDHIFYGVSDAVPVPNQNEVAEWRYLSPELLVNDVMQSPDKYTAWFKMIIERNLLGDLIKSN
jgi:isopentenyl-diphosphate delta-isomerase